MNYLKRDMVNILSILYQSLDLYIFKIKIKLFFETLRCVDTSVGATVEATESEVGAIGIRLTWNIVNTIKTYFNHTWSRNIVPYTRVLILPKKTVYWVFLVFHILKRAFLVHISVGIVYFFNYLIFKDLFMFFIPGDQQFERVLPSQSASDSGFVLGHWPPEPPAPPLPPSLPKAFSAKP